MEQFKIFLKGFATMLIILAIAITCIGAITTKDPFFITTAVISLFVVIYKTLIIND